MEFVLGARSLRKLYAAGTFAARSPGANRGVASATRAGIVAYAINFNPTKKGTGDET
jgi:hypothetical protein